MKKISNLWTKRAFAGSVHYHSAIIIITMVAVFASQSLAQNDKMTPIETPSQPDAVEIGTGPLPDAMNPEAWHSQYGSKFESVIYFV
jgi:hypothetical protein